MRRETSKIAGLLRSFTTTEVDDRRRQIRIQSFQRLLNARLSCYALKNAEIKVSIIAAQTTVPAFGEVARVKRLAGSKISI